MMVTDDLLTSAGVTLDIAIRLKKVLVGEWWRGMASLAGLGELQVNTVTFVDFVMVSQFFISCFRV